MNIISMNFFLLVGITVFAYWICSQKIRWIILLISSGIFVWFANEQSGRLCAVMLCMIMAAYIAGLLFTYLGDRTGLKRIVLLVLIIVEVGTLIRFKEFSFFLNLFGIREKNPWTISLIAPMGISYYTLSLIGYICDTYWGVQKAERNPFKFLLLGSYFPLLASGPILVDSVSRSEVLKSNRFCYDKICFGIQRILWGLFKKLVISERLAVIVNTVYADPNTYRGLYIWVGMACFTLQLYTDFSGCLDIIYGVSDLFNINLPENFELPFLARNISDFWRRWHITLGTWIKNYVLYPTLKSRPMLWIGEHAIRKYGKKFGKKIPIWIGLLVTWIVNGLWHGGAWNYIIGMGVWMWFLIVLGDIMQPVLKWTIKKLHINTECFSWHLFQSGRTFVLFTIGLGMFRANSFTEGLCIYKAGISELNPWIFFNSSFLQMGLSSTDILVLQFSIFFLIVAGIIRTVSNLSVREWIANQNLVFRWLLWISLFVFVLIYGLYGPGYDVTDFIYRGF